TGALPVMVKNFNAKYAGQYTANYREMPTDTGQYFDQLRTEFQAGGGNIDLIGGDVIWPAQFAAVGYILDLSDRFTEAERQSFLPGPVESNTYEGKVYGVPWYTDVGLLYYRKDLLEQSGFSEPPATWDELKEQALRIVQNSGTKNGFIFQGANYEGGVVNGLEYVYSHGGTVLDENDKNKVVIGSPEAAAGLQTERSMVAEGLAPESVTTFTETESEALFLRGESVFLRTWPQLYSKASDSEQSTIEQAQVGVAPLPAGEGGRSAGGLGGWNFFINAASDPQTQDAAYEFIRFATSPEQQRFYALEGSRLPTLQELYQDQEVLDAVPVIKLAGEQALRDARPRPVSPFYSDMSLEMAKQFNASLKGEVSPEEATQTLQEKLTEIVKQGQMA
ncbi:MAG: trehalose/maltose transport system substrate-binding protein, partial [Rubrobacteraceae bacterium]|nr:trehalose/maltose transport system substrate-binding protein [Rubrobacteraceae bacterium]